MSNIYRTLDYLQSYPTMYLGQRSITLLGTFLDGYRKALDHHQILHTELPPFFLFTPWIANRFNNRKSISWDTILLEYHQGDEEKALAHFFDLLAEFKRARPIWMGKIVVSEESVRFYEEAQREFTKGLTIIERDDTEPELLDTVYLVEFSQQLGHCLYEVKGGKLLVVANARQSGRSEAIQSLQEKYGPGYQVTQIPHSDILPLLEKLTKPPSPPAAI